MLIIYDLSTGAVESISGIKGGFLSESEIHGISLVDELPASQSELRIFSFDVMSKIWDAFETGAVFAVALDDNGEPIGIKANGQVIASINEVS